MNSFGRIFRVSIFGESHGPAVGVIIDGVPSGINLKTEDFSDDLLRRQGGNIKGTTPRKEKDEPVFISGVFNGFTTGAPLLIQFPNENTKSSDYEKLRAIPRPGHADMTARKKFNGFEDYRGGGHFSGRLTVALVAAGVVAKKITSLATGNNCNISAILTEAGGESDIDLGLKKALTAKDSIGGIVSCSVTGLPAGLGEPFFDSAESLISHIIFSVPAVKGIEFGSGFTAARMKGSEHNDPILDETGRTLTNNAGGINGGLTNGNTLLFRIAIKPTSSTPKEQTSFNLQTGAAETFSIHGRHDLCIALRIPVVIEAATAIALADMLLINNGVKSL